MTAEFTVRKFESSDADSVIALWNKALPSSQPWNQPKDVICRKLNENDGLFFLGFDAWTARWSDLVDFEVVPVTSSPTKQSTN